MLEALSHLTDLTTTDVTISAIDRTDRTGVAQTARMRIEFSYTINHTINGMTIKDPRGSLRLVVAAQALEREPALHHLASLLSTQLPALEKTW